MSANPDPISAYIAGFPAEVQQRLQTLRALIRAEAPEAGEKISYGMPTFELNGNLIHFAAFAKHIGLYPTPGGVSAFAPQLQAYKTAKGSIQFPLDRPLPLDLIRAIVAYRVAEQRAQPPKRR